ncbi:4Fe-4S binding protein [candidate division NPL-UPA2 bacterium]|nr:4Fe-4S binding protein [candidate division NPL-UPA2 bacterium]
MAKKRVVLTFPQKLVDQPITYHLIKDYDLMVNILRARVTPREEGRLVVELSGDEEPLDRGMKYLAELGVQAQPLAQDVKWHQDRCTHCTACISICPSQAFILDRQRMTISFDKDKCIACELCLPVCPYQAIEILF